MKFACGEQGLRRCGLFNEPLPKHRPTGYAKQITQWIFIHQLPPATYTARVPSPRFTAAAANRGNLQGK